MTKVYQIDQIYRVVEVAIKRLFGFCVLRPLQRFNIYNRAERVLESEVPRMAPRHEGTQEMIDRMISENPNLRKSLEQRSDDLLSRLNSVKVVSRDHQPMSAEQHATLEALKAETRHKPLPQTRNTFDFPWHAYAIPEYVPKYRVHLGAAFTFIQDNSTDPELHTPEKIAEQYNLKEEDVNNILAHFRPYRVVTAPEDPRDQSIFKNFKADRIKDLFRANRMNEFYLKQSEKLKERASLDSKENKEKDS